MVITAGDLKAAGIARAAAGGRRGALREVHPHADRAGLRRAVCYAKDAMTGLSLMNRLMDPARARGERWRRIRAAGAARPRPGRSQPRRLSTTRAAPRCAPTFRFPPAPYLDRKRARRAAPGRGVELHQPVHALRPASGLQGQFRKGAGRARTQGAGAVPQRGGREAGGRAIHEGEGGLAVLRSRARRQRHPPVRARRRGADSHLPLRPAAARRRPVPERLHSRCRRTAAATTWLCSW